MRRYTFGPWTATNDVLDNRTHGICIWGNHPSRLGHSTLVAVTETIDADQSDEEQERVLADARLLAAAPELLEALEKLANAFQGFVAGQESKYYELTEAHAAIRKARGDV